MKDIDLQGELQRLRDLVARKVRPAQAMQPVRAVRQEAGLPQRYWFQSSERELLAGEIDGHWLWLEYSFPVGQHCLVLRWREGEPAQLWRVDKQAQRNALNPGSEILEPLSGADFPEDELEQSERAMAEVPHSLCVHVLQLAAAMRQRR